MMIDKELLPHQEIGDWISGLAQCCNLPRSRSQVIARVNSKNFLRSLYFRRGQDSRGNELTTVMLGTEAKLNRFSISKRIRGAVPKSHSDLGVNEPVYQRNRFRFHDFGKIERLRPS